MGKSCNDKTCCDKIKKRFKSQDLDEKQNKNESRDSEENEGRVNSLSIWN